MRSISRREALRVFGAGATLTGLGLAGCGSTETEEPAQEATTEEAEETPKKEEPTEPQVEDIEVSDASFDVSDPTNPSFTYTLTNNSEFTVDVTTKVTLTAAVVDEYGDEQQETMSELPESQTADSGKSAEMGSTLGIAPGASRTIVSYRAYSEHNPAVEEVAGINDIAVEVYEVADASTNSDKMHYGTEDAPVDGITADWSKAGDVDITGTITNTSEVKWEQAEIHFVAFDADGKLWREPLDYSVGSSVASSIASYIKPGESGSFSAFKEGGIKVGETLHNNPKLAEPPAELRGARVDVYVDQSE